MSAKIICMEPLGEGVGIKTWFHRVLVLHPIFRLHEFAFSRVLSSGVFPLAVPTDIIVLKTSTPAIEQQLSCSSS